MSNKWPEICIVNAGFIFLDVLGKVGQVKKSDDPGEST
jgi:hypothetical protein